MKTIIITLIAVLSVSSAFGQKLQLKKASPFTAVKWEDEQPVVQFDNDWYYFEKLDHLSKKEILDFCKKQYGSKWQKRFSEDLVEVLNGLDYSPNIQVDLTLSKNGVSKTYTGTFTLENRQKSLRYNRENRTSVPSKKISKSISKRQALEDLKQFQDILDLKSSYAKLSNFDYKTAIEELATAIIKGENELSIDEFSNELAKIMSEIGDRHSSIKNESFDKKEHKTFGLRIPFGIAVLDDNLIAIKQKDNDDHYTLYYEEYPSIKSIDGISIETLIDTYNYRDKKAPKEAKLSRAASAIQKYGELLFKNNKQTPKSIQVVFTDGQNDTIETFELTTTKKGYTSQLSDENFRAMMEVKFAKKFDGLSKVLNNNIGYIKIPMMYHYEDVEGLESFLENSIKDFSNSKALIIDIRNNPGGGREILQTFAEYIVQPKQSPWVANIAYLRTDENIASDEESMSGRYLYTYDSKNLSKADRKAIKAFNRKYKTQRDFDKSKFSVPFYMVLHSGKASYKKPVYILVNENSFSAATVFTSVFKGLPNVTIVGVTTDGSSGNSRKIHLKNSGIRVKVSTMLSFQRNGKTLDGNGTEPDIYIPIESEQILTGKDIQLKKLVEMINKNN